MKTAGFFPMWMSAFELSEACSSTRAATWCSSVLCCVIWICILSEMMLVPAASGPAMPVLQAAGPCLSCYKTEAGCLAEASILTQCTGCIPQKPAWVPTCGTNVCSFNILWVHCIENTSSPSCSFNAFLGNTLIEIFTDCMLES